MQCARQYTITGVSSAMGWGCLLSLSTIAGEHELGWLNQ